MLRDRRCQTASITPAGSSTATASGRTCRTFETPRIGCWNSRRQSQGSPSASQTQPRHWSPTARKARFPPASLALKAMLARQTFPLRSLDSVRQRAGSVTAGHARQAGPPEPGQPSTGVAVENTRSSCFIPTDGFILAEGGRVPQREGHGFDVTCSSYDGLKPLQRLCGNSMLPGEPVLDLTKSGGKHSTKRVREGQP